jgi:hypothetical protein
LINLKSLKLMDRLARKQCSKKLLIRSNKIPDQNHQK